MVRTAEILGIWRIPCVCHIINLVFQEFELTSKKIIEPIFDLINMLNESEKYQNFIDRKKSHGVYVKKVPKYISNRWTSFCDFLINLYETRFFINEFLGNSFLDSNQESHLRLLQNICNIFKSTITIKLAKKTIKTRMQKYSKPKTASSEINIQHNSPRIERFFF